MCLVFEETKETGSMEGELENSNELARENVSIVSVEISPENE